VRTADLWRAETQPPSCWDDSDIFQVSRSRFGVVFTLLNDETAIGVSLLQDKSIGFELHARAAKSPRPGLRKFDVYCY